MGYEIRYDLSGKMRKISAGQRRMKYIGGIFLTLAVLTTVIWSLGADWAVTVDAFEEMARDLGQGSGIQQAFSGFCLDILQGASRG